MTAWAATKTPPPSTALEPTAARGSTTERQWIFWRAGSPRIRARAAPREMTLRVAEPGEATEWKLGAENTIKWSFRGELGANVAIRGEAKFGRINWPDGGDKVDEYVVGNGSARLDIAVVMGMATVSSEA